MMDDAEKFGSWPDTHQWVYERGWLREFFRQLQANPDVVTTTTFQQYWRENPPHGRAALPVASYAEMGQWALPPARGVQFESWRSRFEREGVYQEIEAILPGRDLAEFPGQVPGRQLPAQAHALAQPGVRHGGEAPPARL